MTIWCPRCKAFTPHLVTAPSHKHYQSTVGRGGKSDYADIQCTVCRAWQRDVDLSTD